MAEENKKNNGESTFRRVYDDTTFFIDSIVEEYDVFPTILAMMRDGNATLELKKRYLLRAIDEAWVNIIEDTIPSLDLIIRNPSRFIEEREEVLPIELSHNISVRSLKHLSQHTNLISQVDGDKIIPSKILNVFREETIQTYENRFINTLINRLFAFVNRRYEIAKKAGQDEKTTTIEFKDSFDHNSVKVNMNFRLEIAESADSEDDKVERNYSKTTDLWRRVEKLNNVVSAYTESEFVKNMGQSFVRPPVMRTNAILKNKDMRQCLALWEFIESYESAGYSMIIQESLEDVDEAYIKELYSTLALQYLIFRYNIKNEFEADSTLASSLSENVLKPRIIDTLDAATEDEFNITEERVAPSPAAERYATLTPDDRLHLKAIEIALDTAEVLSASGEEELEHPFVEEPEPVPEAPAEEEPEETETANESVGEKEPVKVKIHAKSATREPVKVTVKQSEPPERPEPKKVKVKASEKQTEPPEKPEPKRVTVKLRKSGEEE